MTDVGVIEEVYVIAAISILWAMTTIKPLSRGWRNLDSSGRVMIITKLTCAALSVAIAVTLFIKSHAS